MSSVSHLAAADQDVFSTQPWPGAATSTSPRLNLITGATGLLGSHIAEALRRRGERVRALVRERSDTSFLRQIGVDIVPGDLLAPVSIGPAVAGAAIVYHCAARIGNWGSWRDFRTIIVGATRNLLKACAGAGVGRVLHVSSLAVYGRRDGLTIRPTACCDRLITEDEPLARRFGFLDYYARAKTQAERLVWDYPGAVTVVRPSWIYGPRDRNSFPRLVQALRDRWVALVGDGENLLNIVYAGDVAEGAILAATSPAARGQAYHLSTEGEITQRQFFDLLSDSLQLPRVRRHVSVRLAEWGGILGELVARGLRWQRSPHVTQYGTGLLTRSTRFSIAKARAQLDWQPRTCARDGLRRTLEWFLREPTRSSSTIGPERLRGMDKMEKIV